MVCSGCWRTRWTSSSRSQSLSESAEELEKTRRGHLRLFLRQIVPAGQRAAVHVRRKAAPDVEHIEVASYDALLTPEHQGGARHFAATVGAVMLQIDRGTGAVVLHHRMQPRWIAKGAGIAFHRPGIEGVQAADAAKRPLQEIVRCAADEPLGQIEGLNEEEPVVIAGSEFAADVFVVIERRHDIQDRRRDDAVRIIQRYPVSRPRTTVVAADQEPVEAELR